MHQNFVITLGQLHDSKIGFADLVPGLICSECLTCCMAAIGCSLFCFHPFFLQPRPDLGTDSGFSSFEGTAAFPWTSSWWLSSGGTRWPASTDPGLQDFRKSVSQNCSSQNPWSGQVGQVGRVMLPDQIGRGTKDMLRVSVGDDWWGYKGFKVNYKGLAVFLKNWSNCNLWLKAIVAWKLRSIGELWWDSTVYKLLLQAAVIPIMSRKLMMFKTKMSLI